MVAKTHVAPVPLHNPRVGVNDTFADVLAANAEYARGFNLAGLEPKAARGLAVLTCIDSRIEPLAMLGLRPGDAKILRNAGGRVTDDVVRSLFVSAQLLGVERVMVIAHTKCRMSEAGDDDLRRAIVDAGGPDAPELPLLAAPDQEAAVLTDVEKLRASPLLPGVRVGGFVYDVDSGRLRRIC
jgi:carbonic anhydrase